MERKIKYDKYSEYSAKQIEKSLLDAQKKVIDLQSKIKENKELIAFLKLQVKNNKSQHNFVPMENSDIYQSYLDMSEQDRQSARERIKRYESDNNIDKN